MTPNHWAALIVVILAVGVIIWTREKLRIKK